MNSRRFTLRRFTSLFCGLLLSFAVPRRTPAQPTPAADAGFNTYVAKLESRLDRQHQSADGFIAPAALASGRPVVERLAGADFPGAQLYHWRGTAFVPGATASAFERLLRDFKSYPHTFAPEVLTASVTSEQPDHLLASMRVRQKHVLTVVLDTTYDIRLGRLDPHDGFSASRSTSIHEIDAPGTPQERARSPADDHGFLWRLNTYWTYEERDGGLYLQIETVSLSRAIPSGLSWAIRPYVDGVPRESLEFTLQSACKALAPTHQENSK